MNAPEIRPKFLKAGVVLPVSDIYETVDWYQRVLGFATRYIHGSGRRGETENFANYAIMSRDAVEVSFILDEGGPVWTRAGTGYFPVQVSDVDSIYAEVKAQGATIHRELQRENWPARGFIIKDPAGNEIRIDQPL